MDTKALIEEILIGLALLIALMAVLAALFIPGFVMGEHNRAKVEHLTTLCVDHGYRGWSDDGSVSGCTR